MNAHASKRGTAFSNAACLFLTPNPCQRRRCYARSLSEAANRRRPWQLGLPSGLEGSRMGSAQPLLSCACVASIDFFRYVCTVFHPSSGQLNASLCRATIFTVGNNGRTQITRLTTFGLTLLFFDRPRHPPNSQPPRFP